MEYDIDYIKAALILRQRRLGELAKQAEAGTISFEEYRAKEKQFLAGEDV